MKSKEEVFREGIKLAFDPEVDLNQLIPVREIWSFEDLICYIRDVIFKNDILYPPVINFIFGQKNEEILLTFGEALNEVPIVIYRNTDLIDKNETNTVICAKIRSELLRDDMDAWQIEKAGEIISLIEEHPEAFDKFFDNF